ncbi:MAG: DUF2461 domain-containing protein [bacterium]|nr:DUF2461 domain-containing protein [bacterium]
MTGFNGFPKDTLRFLAALERNNDRQWFAENKSRYEAAFLEPSLELIRSMEKPLAKTAPLLVADAKKSGGSLMRIYRDTRFSSDKTPYKTNIGIHFRHASGKDVHAPGVYLHIANDGCFLGAGIWRAPSDALRAIRQYMCEHPDEWKRVAGNKNFRENFSLYDDRLRTAPRGFPKDHPLVEDLKLKSFIGTAPLSAEDISSPLLSSRLQQLIRQARPLMNFLCTALNQPY